MNKINLMLHAHQPYVRHLEYEKFLEEKGKRFVPDFTFEDAAGDPIIWEHLGMLSNPAYKESWDKKLAFYKSIGFEEGTNLFTTIDHENGSIDSDEIREVLEAVLQDLLQPGEPFLLDAPDEGFVIPAQIRHHDDVAAGGVAAHVAVALHEDDVLCARPGRRDGRGVTGSAAAHHQNVALVVNGNFGALLQISQFLLAHRLSFLLLRPGISRKCRDDFG